MKSSIQPGALIAYEQNLGVIEHLTFNQWGVELGERLANRILQADDEKSAARPSTNDTVNRYGNVNHCRYGRMRRSPHRNQSPDATRSRLIDLQVDADMYARIRQTIRLIDSRDYKSALAIRQILLSSFEIIPWTILNKF